MRQSPGAPRTHARRKGTQVWWPANQVRNGVASRVASAQSSCWSAAASAFWKAAMYRSRCARACGSAGSGGARGGRGALQRALDRGGGGAEHGGDLGGREGQHVPQDEDRPLRARQVLQAGDEREPQDLARGDGGRRNG